MNKKFEKINAPKYTTQELRRIATTNFPIGFGAKEQALQYSADVIDAANDFIDELQAKIDAQAEELKALRGFACDMFNYELVADGFFERHELIDENGNPTKLLAGDK